jgi:hypothetical protein
LKNGSSPCDCAFREAQASLLCDVKANYTEGTHLYIAGSFEAEPSDAYGQVLKDCGLIDASTFSTKSGIYSRKLRTTGETVLWDTVWVNEAVIKSKYLDVMTVINLTVLQDLHLNDLTYPLVLFVHQPLTARWKTFEIAFTSVAVPFAVAYFVWLLVFAKPKIMGGPKYTNI